MTPALRNAAAMRRGQFAHDNAEPEHDYAREEAEERIAELFDKRDPATVQAFAEHVNDRIDCEQVHNLLQGLLTLSDSRWEYLRFAMREDLVAEPLHAIWLEADRRRAAFIEERAAELLKDSEA